MSHMIFADICYLVAETKDPILKMFGDVSGNQMKRGLVWKEDRVELIS